MTFLVGAVLLTGCSSGAGHFIGAWRGSRNLKAGPNDDQVLLNSVSRIDLDIHDDGTFLMIDAGAPKTGTVSYREGKAFLHVETFMNRPISEQGIGAIKMNQDWIVTSRTGDSLEVRDPGGFDLKPVIMKRRSQP